MSVTGHQRRRRRARKRRRSKKKEKLTIEDLEQKPGGWYEFPDGSKEHGKDRAEKKIKEWNGGA